MAKGSSVNGSKIALALAIPVIGAIGVIIAALITNISGTERNATPGLTVPSASHVCSGPPKVKLDANLAGGDANYDIYALLLPILIMC